MFDLYIEAELASFLGFRFLVGNYYCIFVAYCVILAVLNLNLVKDMALSVALPLAGLETEGFNSYSSFGHIIDIAGLSQSQSSPSPSVSSESSGIGSLGSLKSESVDSDSLPSSPQTTEKKLFEPFVQLQPRPKENKVDEVKVAYGGRDILNLMGNLSDPRWSYRPTVLPPNNPALFFANRSQYHRLGPYGTRTQYVKDSCRICGFSWVVAATD